MIPSHQLVIINQYSIVLTFAQLVDREAFLTLVLSAELEKDVLVILFVLHGDAERCPHRGCCSVPCIDLYDVGRI